MEIKPFYSGRAYYDITGDNGEKYVFVPQEFVEKGFVQDGLQFYSPGFLTPGALSTASAFTLPSDSSLTDAAKSIYQNPTKGFVWKATFALLILGVTGALPKMFCFANSFAALAEILVPPVPACIAAAA